MKKRVLQANGLSFGAFEYGAGERTALLLHGFPDDPATYFALMEQLAASGIRCIAPYMRGYGETDKGPDGNYFISELAKDAVDLAKAVGNGKPVVLIGHDWGAATAYAAANLSPQTFSHVVAMAVPPAAALRQNLPRQPGQLAKSWYMAFFQLSILSEWALMRNDCALIEKLWQDWSPGWAYDNNHLASVKGTFRVPGTAKAALSYYRAILRPPRRAERPYWRDTYRLMSQAIAIPGLLIAGQNDGCIGIGMYDGWQAGFQARCRLEIVAAAGHFMHTERPNDVADRILAFL